MANNLDSCGRSEQTPTNFSEQQIREIIAVCNPEFVAYATALGGELRALDAVPDCIRDVMQRVRNGTTNFSDRDHVRAYILNEIKWRLTGSRARSSHPPHFSLDPARDTRGDPRRTPEQEAEYRELSERLKRESAKLDKRQQYIVERLGQGASQAQIARELGLKGAPVSEATISREKDKAFGILRTALGG